MKFIGSLPYLLLVTMLLLSSCSSTSSTAFHYTGDGEPLLLQPDDVPPG